MRNVVLATVIVCGFGASFGVCDANAAVIDTFDFTQVGWTFASASGATVTTGSPDPGGVLTGSFTGTVEPSGLIELGDLTAFSAVYSDAVHPQGLAPQNLIDIALFSYNIAGGASSLDIAFRNDAGGVCVGASVSLDSNCTLIFAISFTPGINGAVYPSDNLPGYVTLDQPTITLVSSVTTGSGSVPEPPTSVLFLTALTGMLAFTGWTARRQPSRVKV